MASQAPLSGLVRRSSGRDGIRWLGRAGLMARGVVYGVIGVLALELALGVGGETPSQRGALKRIAGEPLGRVLLVVVAAGLAGYAAWRLATAAGMAGGERERGVVDRIGALASGVAYGLLCATAVKILIGARTAGGANNPKHATAGVLGWTAGPELVAVAGAILLGVGLWQGYVGVRRKFLEQDHTERMSERELRVLTVLGVLGHLARMVVMGLVGYGLIQAAVTFSPGKAFGLDGALARLAHGSEGPVLLGVVSAGLIAFALFSLAEVRRRKL